MLDGLSLVACVITLTGVVLEAVKYARTFSRASVELGEVQEQVEQLAQVLQEVDSQKNALPSNVATTLGTAKITLEHLKSLLENNIITKANNTSRIRRRAWARSRSKVYRIQSLLKEYRTNLIFALAANNSSSAARSEAALMSIGREVGCSTIPSISLRTQLSNMQQVILKTQDAVVFQTNMVNSVLQSVSAGPRSQLCASDEHSSVQDAMGPLEWSNQYARYQSFPSRPPSQKNVDSGPLFPEPVTLLEASQNFFAESYTVDAQVPRSCLVVIGSSEQVIRPDYKTSVYTLFYLNSFRHWHWLTVSIKIPCLSKYWATTMTNPRDEPGAWSRPNLEASALLPYSLLQKIQAYLCQEERFHDDTKLYLWLSKTDTIKRQPQIPYSSERLAFSQSLSASLDALTYLHDLGCQRYDESEVVQVQIGDQPIRFCSSLNGSLVHEVKSISSTPPVEFLYAIRVLHCMNGTAGFSKLIGIVTDDGRKYLKSYLLEVPRTTSSLLQAVACEGIQWERRERWAVQLIKAIGQIHAQGFVAGGLTAQTVPLVDDTDSIRLWTFKERFVPGRKIGAYYPPEFRHVRNMSWTISEANCPRVTSKTDIFHLGLLLWLLAENKPATHESPWCRRSGCKTYHYKDTVFDLSHAEPIALPPLSESIPKYFRDTVDACRRENPSERPAAREILQKFSFPNSFQQSRPELADPHNGDTKMTVEGMKTTRNACNDCAKNYIQIPYFHCNVCDSAQFDLCQTCYDRGKHCRDDSHLLVELGKIGSWIVPKKYHSSVKSSGVREIIDL